MRRTRRLTAIFATRRMPGKEAIPILSWPCATLPTTSACWPTRCSTRRKAGSTSASRPPSAASPAPRRRDAARCTGLARWYWELAYLGWPRAACWSTSNRRANILGRRCAADPRPHLRWPGASPSNKAAWRMPARPPGRRAGIDSAWRRSAPRWRSSSGATGTSPASRRNARRRCNGRPSRPWRDTGHDRTHRSDSAHRRCLPAAGGHLALCPRRLQLGQPVDPRLPDLLGVLHRRPEGCLRQAPLPDPGQCAAHRGTLPGNRSSPPSRRDRGSSETERRCATCTVSSTTGAGRGRATRCSTCSPRAASAARTFSTARPVGRRSPQATSAIAPIRPSSITLDPALDAGAGVHARRGGPADAAGAHATRSPPATPACWLHPATSLGLPLPAQRAASTSARSTWPRPVGSRRTPTSAEYRTGCRGQLHPSLVDPLLRACRPAHLSRRQSDRRPLRGNRQRQVLDGAEPRAVIPNGIDPMPGPAPSNGGRRGFRRWSGWSAG